MSRPLPVLLSLAALVLAGCVTQTPKDYTELRKARPKSILVLPPLNESPDVRASYSLLTTVTRPLAELGYYVFPVVVVDHFMRENGLTVPGEMHAAPLAKLHEVFGADAILYIVVENYGTKYQVITSNTVVQARAKLVDARNGTLLWEHKVSVVGGGQSGLIEAVVQQVMSAIFDQAHQVAVMASHQLFTQPTQGLLKGPRHPEAGRD